MKDATLHLSVDNYGSVSETMRRIELLFERYAAKCAAFSREDFRLMNRVAGGKRFLDGEEKEAIMRDIAAGVNPLTIRRKYQISKDSLRYYALKQNGTRPVRASS